MRNSMYLLSGIPVVVLFFCSCSYFHEPQVIQREDLIGTWSRTFTKIRTCEAADGSGTIEDTATCQDAYNFGEKFISIVRNKIIETDCKYINIVMPIRRKWFVQNDSLFILNSFLSIKINSVVDSSNIHNAYALQWYGKNELIISDTARSDTCFKE